MSSSLQTILALAIVALAATFLLRAWFGKKKASGCAGSGCSAISPEIKNLKSKLRS